jgi:hypothetical protein
MILVAFRVRFIDLPYYYRTPRPLYYLDINLKIGEVVSIFIKSQESQVYFLGYAIVDLCSREVVN